MATYETHVTIPVPAETAFAFVCDFTNAAHWDPRTYKADTVTDGPIGVGTRFMLTGGLMKEAWVRRLRIPERLAGMPLPYDVIEFDPPNGFVLEVEPRDRTSLAPNRRGAGRLYVGPSSVGGHTG